MAAGVGGILFISSPGSVLRSVIRPGMMFYLGMLAWNYWEYIKLLAVLFIPITYLGYFEWGIYLCGYPEQQTIVPCVEGV